MGNFRTVPTIVSAHTFCASCKTLSKRALGLTLTQSTTLLIKANFPTVTKSSLMNLYVNQEHQNSIISLSSDC